MVADGTNGAYMPALASTGPRVGLTHFQSYASSFGAADSLQWAPLR